MPLLTEEEADALDALLTSTTPEVNPNVEGPFIKNHRLGMIALQKYMARDGEKSRLRVNRDSYDKGCGYRPV